MLIITHKNSTHLGALGEVEVDDDVDGLDVDTAGEQVAAHQVAGRAVAELVKHSAVVQANNCGGKV